jgi:2,3-bisphosphoglycerate-dependent phosphoglycerate mutase
MSKLILLRHGESVCNKLNVFTGWIDVPLSKEGIRESIEVGKALSNLNIDVIYVSSLVRSQTTAFLAMAENKTEKILCIEHQIEEPMGSWYQGSLPSTIPVYIAWELNERMYGTLQGKNKQQTIEEHGAEQVKLWRRSYDVCPPGGESLEKTAARTIPFFEKRIVADLKKGLDVLVSAHGNSLRSIVMDIEKLSKEEVLHLEIGTGSFRIYDYRQGLFDRIQ